jgi:hypothetical protein
MLSDHSGYWNQPHASLLGEIGCQHFWLFAASKPRLILAQDLPLDSITIRPPNQVTPPTAAEELPHSAARLSSALFYINELPQQIENTGTQFR